MTDRCLVHNVPTWLSILLLIGLAVGSISAVMFLLGRFREIQASAARERKNFYYVFLPILVLVSASIWMVIEHFLPTQIGSSRTSSSLKRPLLHHDQKPALESSWPDAQQAKEAYSSILQGLFDYFIVGARASHQSSFFWPKTRMESLSENFNVEVILTKSLWTLVMVAALGIAYFKSSTRSRQHNKNNFN